jgi:C-terminal processing protease CtpA/Prc
MNLRSRVVVGIMLVALALPHVEAQGQNTQLTRLAHLGTLWGYIKYTHPWIGYRGKEWDQGLIAAIPKVKGATSPEEYAQAIDHMLSFLGDPATRRIASNFRRPGDEVAASPMASRPQPSIEWPHPDVAIISANDYAALDNSPTGRSDLGRLIAEAAAKATSVVFDIRRVRDEANMGRIGSAVLAAINGQMSRLVKAPIPLPATRFAYHQGYAPQTGPYPSYYSGLLELPGGEVRIPASTDRRPAHLVFITNTGSADLYATLSGLQDQGLASVVQEGDAFPDAGVLFTYTNRVMELPDGINVQVRRGEIVHANGVTGFRPDVVVAAATTTDVDPARDAAVALSKAPRTKVDERAPLQRLSFIDDSYPQTPYPSEEHRLLGLFRFWSLINHFYPYKELMDQPWEKTLDEFIPRMQRAGDATEYALTVAELVARLQDSHGAISSPAFDAFMGSHRPPLQLAPAEGQMVVIDVDEAAKDSVGLKVGDVVLAVDNEDVAQRRGRLTKYLPESTVGSLHNSHARHLLRGPRDSEAVLKVKTPTGEVKDVRVTRSVAGVARAIPRPRLPIFTVLPEGFGYVDFDRLAFDQVKTAYAAVKSAPGLIIDLRGYIGSGAQEFMGALVKTPNLPVLMISRLEYDGAAGEFRKNTIVSPTYRQVAASPYQGKVVVLIGSATVSAAESATMSLGSIGLDVTYIGAPTTGANGNVTNATLPGGIAVRFTGMEIRHADGRQLQRRGIQPTVDVRPTIQGIAAGRDEVLERAVAILKSGAH